MRIAVVGAGVVGLSVAWRLAVAGHDVELHDDAPGQGASHAAAGMLAPAGEAWFGEEELIRLGLAGLRQWPEFAARLGEAAGLDVGLRTEGSLLVGVDDADAATLDQVRELLSRHGVDTEQLTRREPRRHESGLAPGLRRVVLTTADRSVDNRLVVQALQRAAAAAGVVLRGERVDVDGRGVRTRDGDAVQADAVVVAAGADLRAVRGLPEQVAGAVRPVKGQILRLRTESELVTHTVRGLVRGDAVYIVPRADGELVVGATSEELGRDVRVTGDGVYELLRRGIALVPGLRECEFVEAIARSRPGTPDNLPLIGPVDDGVFVAGGHYRAGFLLAPTTAEAILAYVEGRPPPEEIAGCDPARFGLAPVQTAPGAFGGAYGRKTEAEAREETI